MPSKLGIKRKVEVALLPARPKKTWMRKQSSETAYLVALCTSDFQMANKATQFTGQDRAHLELIYQISTYAGENICIDE